MTTTKKTASKKFANPYRPGSNYHAIVDTLEKLGANRTHEYSKFESQLKSTWKNFKAFASKEARNESTAKSALGKLLVNVGVLQRTESYGKGLTAQNACIDLSRNEKGALQIALNLRSKKPTKAGRAPKVVAEKKTVKVVAKKKPVAAKPTTPLLAGRDAIALLKKSK